MATATVRRSKRQIYGSLLITILGIGFGFEVGLAHQCQHSAGSDIFESHAHHHHHDDDGDGVLGVRKLPEELAEEEDLKLLGFGSHHNHDHDHDHDHGGSELSGIGLWIHAMGCSLLVSLASLICLILLPLILFQGKPSKAFVDSLAVFGAGAMLGDAFLHQLPHAFGGEQSHSHSHHADNAHQHISSGHDHSHSHAHSLKDLSVGLSILFGIVLFLLVEKIVRYVEDMSGGVDAWGHHHHHHHKKSETLKDLNGGNGNAQAASLNDEDEISEMTSEEEVSEKAADQVLKAENQSESSVRKRNTSTSADGNKPHSSSENRPNSNIKSISEKGSVQSSSRLVFGYLNLFSDGVHNFTDGMALGSAFLLHGSVGGWSRTLFLLAHELPQEIGDFGILVRSGFSAPKALFFNFLSALVALAGTALALSLGQDPGQSSLIEGFTAGGFIYIAVAGVLAEMNNGSSSLKSTALQLTSLVLGMSVALYISLVE